MPSCTVISTLSLHDALPIWALIPYLHRLGISHVYTSPLFSARPGSLHGYDVCDFQKFNPELGTEREFETFVEELKGHGMGLVLRSEEHTSELQSRGHLVCRLVP